MRVLVTENDPLVQRYLAQQAAELGAELVFARDGAEARRAIDDCDPDCIVLDTASSVEETVPLWRALRRDPETQHLPLLLYSSSQRWQCVAELAAREVDGLLPRPFSAAALLEAAQRASTRRAALA